MGKRREVYEEDPKSEWAGLYSPLTDRRSEVSYRDGRRVSYSSLPWGARSTLSALASNSLFQFSESVLTRPYKGGSAYLVGGIGPADEEVEVEFWNSGGQLLGRMWVNGVLTPLSQHSATALVLPDLMMRLSKDALELQDAEHLKSELADVEVSDDELRMIGRMVSDLEGSSVEALSTSATLEDLKAHLSPENFARIMKEVESSRRRRGRAFPKGWNEGV